MTCTGVYRNRFFHLEQTPQNCKQCSLLSSGQSGHGIPVGLLSCLGEAASPELGRKAGLRMLLAVGTF